jgi:diguanylate cyclase (GGDEF)-like protein
VAILRADVDRFMVFNDWVGFVEGDLLLARLVGMTASVVRERSSAPTLSLARRDVVALVPGLAAPDVEALGARLVERMREARVQLRHAEVRNVPYMTVSVGAAIVDPSRRSLEDALAALDLVVLAAKQAGRDRAAVVLG